MIKDMIIFIDISAHQFYLPRVVEM